MPAEHESHVRSSLVCCLSCQLTIRESRFQKHIDEAHGPHGSRKVKVVAKEMSTCPRCGNRIRSDRLQRHIQKIHISPKQKPKRKIKAPLPKFRLSDQQLLPGPRISLSRESLHGPAIKKDRSPDLQPPIGKLVLDDLRNNIRWTAISIESCLTCRRRIVFLDVGNSTRKAFDVDRNRNILGTHSCEERSESVYAFRGGIADSNRRRH